MQTSGLSVYTFTIIDWVQKIKMYDDKFIWQTRWYKLLGTYWEENWIYKAGDRHEKKNW